MKTWIAFLALAFWFHPANSAYDEFVIGSSADRFQLVRQPDGRYYVGDQAVQLGTFKDFIYLFGTNLEGACPKLKQKPDITIIAKKSKTDALGDSKTNQSKRNFYLDEKMVQGDGGCAPISGDGIYYLPMHRFWFTGEDTLSIPAIRTIKIEKDGDVLAHVKRQNNSWEAEKDMEGLNWEFFENFVGSLEQFPVFARLHPAIGKGKPHFKVTLNGEKYEAWYVAKNLWAMKFPKSTWLVASQQWSKWENMRVELWRDRHFDLIRTFADKKNEPEKRKASMMDLGTRWSPSIKVALQKIIKDPAEPVELRSLALRFLKQRPSLDNFGAMIHALKVSTDREFLIQLTQTLKIRNPRGPQIKESSSDDDVQAAIREWNQWWQKIGQ